MAKYVIDRGKLFEWQDAAITAFDMYPWLTDDGLRLAAMLYNATSSGKTRTNIALAFREASRTEKRSVIVAPGKTTALRYAEEWAPPPPGVSLAGTLVRGANLPVSLPVLTGDNAKPASMRLSMAELGWSKQYESNIFRGFEEIEKWAKRANPDAPSEVIAAKVDAATAGAGVKVVEAIGLKVTPGRNLESGPQASLALDALSGGSVTAEDVRERGAEALVAPREKGKRKHSTLVERAFALVERMTPTERLDFARQIQPLLAAAEDG